MRLLRKLGLVAAVIALLAAPVMAIAPNIALAARSTAPLVKPNKSVPQGAMARCKDGTYSFSKNHQGTCSHHKGVSVWYR